MSRTTWSAAAAAVLAAGAVGVMAARYTALGDEVHLPGGGGVWKVTLLVQGKSAAADARVHTAVPAELDRQHVLREETRGDEFRSRTHEANPAGDRHLLWTPKAATPGAFRLRYECHCTLPPRPADAPPPSSGPYGPPRPGEHLQADAGVTSTHEEIAAVARRLTADRSGPAEQAEALFRYVDAEVAHEPSVAGPPRTALECLRLGSGDSGAQSRLLVALLRNRGVPARLVFGLTLTRENEQAEHAWVEAWVGDHWLPMCPFYHHFGQVPRTYLVLGFGEPRVAVGHGVGRLTHAFLVERLAAHPAAERPWAYRFFAAASLYDLPPAERKLAEFLLLLPVAALIVCVFRNLIGVQTFGTFAPALVGLAFRELHSLPGVLLFVVVLLVGWLLRRALGRFHLLQVPRTALLLTLVVTTVLTFVVLAHRNHLAVARYIALFPMVILTGMIERFWTLEEEDGTAASFKTLVSTIGIAGCISLLVSIPAVARQMLGYPETLGLLMAAFLLLGRYTGYRVLELYRFREFLRPPPAPPEPEPEVLAERTSFDTPRF
jgi:hypothetical protein